MTYHRLTLGLVALLAGLNSKSSSACLYFDRSIALHSFNETDREALLFHDGDAANLILKTGFSGNLPKKLAWVFPVASKPVAYKVTSPEVFKSLALVMRANMPRSKSRAIEKSLGGAPMSSIKVHDAERVGNYEIIPIEILSQESGDELNSWLKNQGFIESPKEIQTPYLKKGSFFLAIRATLQGSDSELQPLWIRYKSNSLSFPWRFTHEYRSFNSKVYFLIPKNTKIKLPSGGGWDINTRTADVARVDEVHRHGEWVTKDQKGKDVIQYSSFDAFADLLSKLTEFKDVRSVSQFLARKDLKLAMISIKQINSPDNVAAFQTKRLKNDPEVIL